MKLILGARAKSLDNASGSPGPGAATACDATGAEKFANKLYQFAGGRLVARLQRRRVHCGLLDHRPAVVSEGLRRHRRHPTGGETCQQVAQPTALTRRQQKRPGTRQGSSKRRSDVLTACWIAFVDSRIRGVYPPNSHGAISPFSCLPLFCHPRRKQFLDTVYAILCNLCAFQ